MMSTRRMNVLRTLLLLGLLIVASLALHWFGKENLGVMVAFAVTACVGAAFLFGAKPKSPEALRSSALQLAYDLFSSRTFLAVAAAVVWIVAGAGLAIEVRGALRPDRDHPGLVVEVGPTVDAPPAKENWLDKQFVGGYAVSHFFPTFVPFPQDVPDPEFKVVYSAQRHGDTTFLTYKLPYLDRLENGEPVEGIHVGYDGYFSWEYPVVSVRVVNNSTRVVQFGEALITVHRSDVKTEPVPVIDGFGLSGTGSTGDMPNIGFEIVNDGWGPLINAELEFAVETRDPTTVFRSPITPATPLAHSVRFPRIGSDSTAAVPLEEAVPGENAVRRSVFITPEVFAAAERAANTGADPVWVAVVGRLSYETAAGETRSVPFRTGIEVHPEGFGDGFDENSYPYSVCLPAGIADEYSIPTSQTVQPGGSDRFTLQIGTDKSARFVMSVAFRATGGKIVQAGHVVVDAFVPARKTEQDRRCTTDSPLVPVP